MPGSAELAYWVECVGACGCAMMVEDPATIAWVQQQLAEKLEVRWLCRKCGCDRSADLFPRSKITIA